MDIWYTLWTFGILYGHLVYFMDIWYILRQFGIFSPFWYVVPRKIWQPWLVRNLTQKKTVFLCISNLLLGMYDTKTMFLNTAYAGPELYIGTM
jgi:hypothetical protein